MESTSHESLILACGNNSEGQSGIAGGEEETIRLPLPLTKTADLQYDKVIAVCSSLRQSFAVTSDYLLLSCGENDANQLARSGKRSTLLHIDMLSKYRIRDVAAGNGFFHACTVDGRVISWGKNDLGQLGDGGRESREKPKLNSNFTESILQIVCGESHCIALTNGGNVLTFGGNRKGQLGDGQLTSSCVPRISPALRHRPIIGICAGANHCLAFTVTGATHSLLNEGCNCLNVSNFKGICMSGGTTHMVSSASAIPLSAPTPPSCAPFAQPESAVSLLDSLTRPLFLPTDSSLLGVLTRTAS